MPLVLFVSVAYTSCNIHRIAIYICLDKTKRTHLKDKLMCCVGGAVTYIPPYLACSCLFSEHGFSSMKQRQRQDSSSDTHLYAEEWATSKAAQ